MDTACYIRAWMLEVMEFLRVVLGAHVGGGAGSACQVFPEGSGLERCMGGYLPGGRIKGVPLRCAQEQGRGVRSVGCASESGRGVSAVESLTGVMRGLTVGHGSWARACVAAGEECICTL